MVAAKSVELHCHLDGSVRLQTIAALASEQGVELDAPVEKLATVSPESVDLIGYIAAIDVALSVLQTPEGLFRAASELVDTWKSEDIVHGEVRFAPALHQRRGLTLTAIIDAVSDGLAAGRDRTGISTSLITCCMRPGDPADSWRVVEAAVVSGRVAGIDLSGPEKGISALPHAPAFQAARAEGLRVTAHAGEADGPLSVWQVIDELGAERIGHGVRSIEDEDLVARLAADRIPLELCPTSNVQTRAVASLGAHPVNAFRASGVPVTISCDARTVSAVTLPGQYAVLREHFGWQDGDWAEAQRTAAEFAFVDRATRSGVQDRLGS